LRERQQSPPSPRQTPPPHEPRSHPPPPIPPNTNQNNGSTPQFLQTSRAQHVSFSHDPRARARRV
jgi:hypothetical protein